MTSSDDPEDLSRRANERLPMAAMVSYRLDGQEYGNLAADVSPAGIFIRTFLPPPAGTRLELTVRLPEEMGGLCVGIEGVVVRVVQGQDPRLAGMGVQFTAIHAVHPDTVRYLVSRIFRVDVLERALEEIKSPQE